MSVFIRILLKLSVYANKKYITIFMTYLYVLTFVVLISSHVRLSKDYVLRDIGLKSYLKRSLSEYNEQDTEMKGHAIVKEQDENNVADSMFINKMPQNNERGNPFRDRKQRQNKEINGPKTNNHEEEKQNMETINKGEIINVKRTDPDNDKKKTIDIENSNAVKSEYPNVEVVNNFHFDNTPDIKEGIFQNITEDGTFLLFSAYLDNINGQPYIKVLAINGNTYLPKFYCEVTNHNNFVVTTKGKIWMLPDHHEKIYKTVFLYCPLPDDNIPHHVSIIPIKKPARLHRLPVMYHPKMLRNFTVCLSPLFFNNSIANELVEWFEINKLMGADLFIVYNHTTFGRTDEILNHYEKEGWIKVIQWQPPVYSDLHYFGQVAMMNDCLFRTYKISKYMVNIDIDELIIPRKGKTTWGELMTSFPQNFCEYSFRSTLMPFESKNVFEGKQRARELNLHFLLRMSRREYIFGKTVRSKYIVNTTCIDTVGIHYCWKYRNGTADTQRYHVTPRDSLTYHFRNEPVAKKGKEIEEKAVYKYHTQLIENAKARWEKINAERKLSKEKT
ncbi:beta-1,4-galactosyltransferase galt-1-like [Mercenaria mercenaria]|uniref:beta-1,4-galactosyltransferase galt-1-like n=1 Tax=Mercenaria mercenaria TaxID=6596 RepID=UPI00234F3692|nr:beta-1,4-galactosyltransferase galt-1-like [Mercenaria mercenaria]